VDVDHDDLSLSLPPTVCGCGRSGIQIRIGRQEYGLVDRSLTIGRADGQTRRTVQEVQVLERRSDSKVGDEGHVIRAQGTNRGWAPGRVN